MMCNICQCGYVDVCPVIHTEKECTFNDCQFCQEESDQ